ncbi:hypothetical protein SAE02_61310 [Skermanella aerolata]|uniref:Uncharacterized protein n=1 Tax=Skermanella aerolata TaxID=393310 RepID=A0A512DZS3_9PROT|nr:hypothetical protein [Skermanella aerolata]KJB91910.1 hypothetical protein N826_25675 [Skermanella aerolata KACC 11604]GEO41983.1 hypothetical protein SAE02_61310 [Skermanella aerolata]
MNTGSPTRYYERYEIEDVVPPESPIEKRMYDLLATDIVPYAKSVFGAADGWLDAARMIEDDAALLSRRRVVIFPQTKVGDYRADFLVAVTDRHFDRSDAFDDFDLFFIECDGAEHHGGTNMRGVSGDTDIEAYVEMIRKDRKRDKHIKSLTGLDILRFGGAEINFSSRHVRAVLEAYIEAHLAHRLVCRMRLDKLTDQGYGRDEIQNCLPDKLDEISRVIAFARDMASMPVLRNSIATEKTNSGGMATLLKLVDEMRRAIEKRRDDP